MPTVPSGGGAGSKLYFKFTSRDAGVPFTLAGSPVVSVYKDDSTTQSTTGVTLTADFDSVTGLNHITVDTSTDTTFYAAGHHYELIITTGTVNGTSVVGEDVGSFDLSVPSSSEVIRTNTAQAGASTTITLDSGASATDNLYQYDTINIASGTGEGQGRFIVSYVGSTKVATVDSAWATNPDSTSVFTITPTAKTVVAAYVSGQAPLQPTVAGRTLNVSTGGAGDANVATILGTASSGAAGYVGVDWGQVTNKTTTNALTGTTISSSQVVASVSGAVSSITGVTFPTNFSALAITAGGIASADIQTVKTQTVTCSAGVTVNVNVGTTQPVNFTGTAGSALVKTDMVDVAGSAVSTGSAQIGTSVVSYASGQDPGTLTLDAFATGVDTVQASPTPTTTAFAGSSSLSSSDDFYSGSVLMFTGGALDGLARKITSYTGSTRLITVTVAWPTAPSSADPFRILGRID